MKMKLAEYHSFREELVEQMDFLNQELTAEEILAIMVGKHGPMMPLEITGDTVIVDHPYSY